MVAEPLRLALSPSASDELRRRFIAGMGRTTGAVTIVTTEGTAGRFGQTVTAMMSVSADPPTLVVSLYRAAPVADAVRANQCFAVNVLSVEHLDAARAFAGQGGSSSRYRFGDEWTSLRTGSPVLPTAAAAFDCHAEQFLVAGSHLLIVGRVVDVRATDAHGLTYADRAYGRQEPLVR
ncbi:flavin reductase family protein [Saccharothrix sp. AJ9571]|nr:flavin reductase family protein [Saccharothrix sp. AJ9571]